MGECTACIKNRKHKQHTLPRLLSPEQPPIPLLYLAGKYSKDKLPKGPRGALFRQILPGAEPLLQLMGSIAESRGKTYSQVGSASPSPYKIHRSAGCYCCCCCGSLFVGCCYFHLRVSDTSVELGTPAAYTYPGNKGAALTGPSITWLWQCWPAEFVHCCSSQALPGTVLGHHGSNLTASVLTLLHGVAAIRAGEQYLLPSCTVKMISPASPRSSSSPAHK